MTILIITGMEDVHADCVIPQISQQTSGRRQVVRLNTDNFTKNCAFNISSPQWDGRLHFQDSDKVVSLSEVDAVWYRKPVPMRQSIKATLEPAAEFIADEYSAFLQSTIDLLAEKFWVSKYWNIRMAGQKLPNLKLASELGLLTPRTLVTNSQIDARRFAENSSWRVLAKPFGLTTFKLSPESADSWDTFATIIDEEAFGAIAESISLAPTMLQEYVEKDLELRVTVVGKRIFCTAIDSQKHVFAKQDWRAVDVEELNHKPFDLPTDLEEKLLKFNRHYGLQFSTFDIILNKAGQFIWLECNPNGQWLWIEELTGQKISMAITDLLLNPDDGAL